MRNIISRAMALGAEGIGNLEADRNQKTLKNIGEWLTGARSLGRTLVALAAAGTILSLLVGVTRVKAADAAKDQILIGLVTKTEVNPYFVKLRQAATAQAEKHG